MANNAGRPRVTSRRGLGRGVLLGFIAALTLIGIVLFGLLYEPDSCQAKGAQGEEGGDIANSGSLYSGSQGLKQVSAQDAPRLERRLAPRLVKVVSLGLPAGGVEVGAISRLASGCDLTEVKWLGHSDAEGMFELPDDTGEGCVLARLVGSVSSLEKTPAFGCTAVVTLRRAGSIRVRVVDLGGAPVERARVAVGKQPLTEVGIAFDPVKSCVAIDCAQCLWQADTDADGVATMTAVSPGLHYLRVEKLGMAQMYDGNRSHAIIEVAAESCVTVQVALAPLVAIVAKIDDETLIRRWSFASMSEIVGVTQRTYDWHASLLQQQFPDCIVKVFGVPEQGRGRAMPVVRLRYYSRSGGWSDAALVAQPWGAATMTRIVAKGGIDDTSECRLVVAGGTSSILRGVTLVAKSETDTEFAKTVFIGENVRLARGRYSVTCADPVAYQLLNLPWHFAVGDGEAMEVPVVVPSGVRSCEVRVVDGLTGMQVKDFELTIIASGTKVPGVYLGQAARKGLSVVVDDNRDFEVVVSGNGYHGATIKISGADIASKVARYGFWQVEAF